MNEFKIITAYIWTHTVMQGYQELNNTPHSWVYIYHSTIVKVDDKLYKAVLGSLEDVCEL